MPKAIVFLADGMADLPLDELNGKTPLEAAWTPAMDQIARDGASGTFLTLPEGFPTSSDAANMSVLGYDLARYYPGRGPIEAVSRGIVLKEDDIAWRCNLVYVDNGDILVDYSAGQIDPVKAREIVDALQKRFGSDKVSFHSGVSYRNLLITHGKEFSAAARFHKPDSSQGKSIYDLRYAPADNTREAKHTIAFIENLVRDCAKFLRTLPANAATFPPANYIWPWSPGKRPSFPPFSEKYAGKKGAIISAVDVVRGIGVCAGMDVIDVPGATGYIDTNYEGKAASVIDALKNHDFVYAHVEAPDECSHMGNITLKIQAIEDFDARLVTPILQALKGQDVTFAVLPDHPCPVKERKHTRTPVPFAVCGSFISPDDVNVFSEQAALFGRLGPLRGDQLARLIMGL